MHRHGNQDSLEDFTRKARLKHADKYGYSKVTYTKSLKKISIICHEHGEFLQAPSEHLSGKGCRKCGVIRAKNSRLKNSSIFISQANSVHNNKYDYSKIIYLGTHKKLEIICPMHGNFWQEAKSHLCGNGCPQCKRIKLKEFHHDSQEKWVKKAKSVHGDKYDYSKIQYKNSLTKIEIVCPIHGGFFMAPFNHLRGQDCPRCFGRNSKPEQEICDFIKKSDPGTEIIQNSRKIIDPQELDIYIPSKNLAIEYCGLYWHSQEKIGKTYHRDKYLACKAKGITLATIFENEWLNKQEIVKSMLLSRLQLTPFKIGARKTEIKEISCADVKTFLMENHLMGSVSGKVYLGLFHNDKMVSCMIFGKSRFDATQWEILRFASLCNHQINGGASKLLTYFISKYSPNIISTYADLRYGEGRTYENFGFKFKHVSHPNYFYFKHGDSTLCSRIQFQKHKLAQKLSNFDPELSEYENMKNNGYNRIYDCGNNVYTWQRNAHENSVHTAK